MEHGPAAMAGPRTSLDAPRTARVCRAVLSHDTLPRAFAAPYGLRLRDVYSVQVVGAQAVGTSGPLPPPLTADLTAS